MDLQANIDAAQKNVNKAQKNLDEILALTTEGIIVLLKKNPKQNPYREFNPEKLNKDGSVRVPQRANAYFQIFAEARSRKIVTMDEMVAWTMENCLNSQGKPMTELQAKASVGVILSPDEGTTERSSDNSHGRGNYSAKGEFYYFIRLKRKTEKDENGKEKKLPQRYQFRWRKEALPAWKQRYFDFSLENQYEKEAALYLKKAKTSAEKALKEAQVELRKAERAKKKAEKPASTPRRQATQKKNDEAREQKRQERLERMKKLGVESAETEEAPIEEAQEETQVTLIEPASSEAETVSTEAETETEAQVEEETTEEAQVEETETA